MNMKNASLLNRLLAVLLALTLAIPAIALAPGSAKALDAFRRYEPDFMQTFKKLEEIGRKIRNQKIDLASEEGETLSTDAEELFEHIQKRYDLLDDLFKSVSESNPGDRASLLDGFSRIDDMYRKARDYYYQTFVNVKPSASAPSRPTPADPDSAAGIVAPATVPEASAHTEFETTGATTVTALPDLTTADSSTTAATTATQQDRALKFSGKFTVGLQNKNEQYPATRNPSRLPNNNNQFKLSLHYKSDARNSFLLEDKYTHRKRNELVQENQTIFGWLHNHSPSTAFAAKDTYQTVRYPTNQQRDYNDNLAELSWSRKYGKYDFFYNVGFENRKYPHYSRSDFTQLNYKSQSTYFIPNGALFSESTWNTRKYQNARNLDYVNYTYDIQYNRGFDGNKSEISVSDIYDRRNYGNEAPSLFRSNYWDNYFTFRYDLPVSKTFTWSFEDEYQKRAYPSDDPRGYSQLKLKTTAKITIDKTSRARVSHQYIYNNENTRAKAHKNNVFTASWDKKYSPRFKVKVEDQFHRRATVVGDIMDFKENKIAAKAVWSLPSKIELTWKNEYLNRNYSALYYSNFKYFTSGITAFYSKADAYDWQITQDFRSFNFGTSTSVPVPSRTDSQDYSEVKLGIVLRKNLKLKFTASKEKTFYKSFDTVAQELLWNFALPIKVTEFTGGLEYEF
jgi:hypothetical protein